jgi:hypothetical protein
MVADLNILYASKNHSHKMPEIIDLIKYISKKIKVAFQKPIV